MSPEYASYLAVVALSSFSLGALGLATWLHFKMSELFDVNFWRATLKLGCMVVIGTILWLVIPQRAAHPSPAFWVYLVGLGLAGIGGIGVCFRSISIYVNFSVQDNRKGSMK